MANKIKINRKSKRRPPHRPDVNERIQRGGAFQAAFWMRIGVQLA